MKKIAAASLLALGVLAVGFATPNADAAPPPCKLAPPAPYGYIGGKIDSVDGNGTAKISYSNPRAMRLYRGADVYVVTCDGVLVKAGKGDVRSFDAASSTLQATFVDKGFKAENAVGQYVFIDAGGDSAPPAGVVSVSVTDIRPDDGDVRLTLGAGEEDGVFPESTGAVHLKDGKRVTFKILTATRRASTIKVRLSVDDAREIDRTLINVRKPRCFGPEPIDQPGSLRGVAPAGYVFADGVKDASKGSTVVVASSVKAMKGAPAYVLDNGGNVLGGAVVESSNGKEVSLRIVPLPLGGTPKADALARARYVLPKVTNAYCGE